MRPIKTARRPILFWWQSVALLGVTALLWWQVPYRAVWSGPRAIEPFPEPHASYVLLAPGEAAQALANMRASWMVTGADGGAPGDLDLGMFDLREEPAPPAFLEQGARYPGVWQPAAVEPLPLALPDIRGPSAEPVAEPAPVPQRGLRSVCSRALVDAAFAFDPPGEALPERSGECRFYLETDDDGSVAHLLLLSPAGASSAVWERAVGRGKARGAARGTVTVMWRLDQRRTE
ncbi:MAG: hypothetical protein LBW77_06735 [Verrucomicrobiota bacterium]|jgi:hypothetical protein|nr:hypothetical protein [Verrucomicrobiota bacterium]